MSKICETTKKLSEIIACIKKAKMAIEGPPNWIMTITTLYGIIYSSVPLCVQICSNYGKLCLEVLIKDSLLGAAILDFAK